MTHTNPWIAHVQHYAKTHHVDYHTALHQARATYHPKEYAARIHPQKKSPRTGRYVKTPGRKPHRSPRYKK